MKAFIAIVIAATVYAGGYAAFRQTLNITTDDGLSLDRAGRVVILTAPRPTGWYTPTATNRVLAFVFAPALAADRIATGLVAVPLSPFRC